MAYARSIGADPGGARRFTSHPLIRMISEKMKELREQGEETAALKLSEIQFGDAVEKFHADPEVKRLKEEMKCLDAAGKEQKSWAVYEKLMGRLADLLTSEVMHRWRITVQRPGRPEQSSLHVREKDAQAYTKRALLEILTNAKEYLNVAREQLVTHFQEYYNRAVWAVQGAEASLAKDDVWGAWWEWYRFQGIDEGMAGIPPGPPPPIGPIVGRMLIEVE